MVAAEEEMVQITAKVAATAKTESFFKNFIFFHHVRDTGSTESTACTGLKLVSVTD